MVQKNYEMEWKCKDDNARMKNAGDESVKRWKIWGWKNRRWKCKDETAGMMCHAATINIPLKENFAIFFISFDASTIYDV